MAAQLRKEAERLKRSGDEAGALAKYEQALKQCDRDGQEYLKIDVYYGLATLYHELSMFKEASDLFEKGLELQGKFGYNLEAEINSAAKASFTLSRCYTLLGREKEASAARARAAKWGYDPDGILLRPQEEPPGTINAGLLFVIIVSIAVTYWAISLVPS
ncbi:hypothetical protein BT69DRAFT_1286873 [Atractiella rhizophila]|nr:hypothetical protein BT69DRAFT_1286873 [Atractiella rhizophila]